ncbi:FkbM family methyltransferase [Hydrogenophaga sp.]|uniref:FkbM family methyltransferase n=1 Tax=Hydrogenophaga sp. TaxID=1904254 RepID=UPI003F725CAE
MNILPRKLKDRLKQYDWILSLYLKVHHHIHRFKDWWGTKVWKKTTLVTTPLGFKLVAGIHPAYKQMREGIFEIEETKIIKRMLQEVEAFVDVGANLGYYTCRASQQGKPAIAFEPQQQNLRCLMQNLTVNGYENNVEVFPLALSERPGLLTLYGASGPSASLIKGWAGYSSKHSQQIPVSTLDTILGTRFESLQIFIKIDVEGAEYQVLRGATQVMNQRIKPVWLLEVSLQEFHPDGTNPDYQKIFDLFFESGYVAYTATNPPSRVDRKSVADWVGRNVSNLQTYNYVFLDPSMAPRLEELHQSIIGLTH